MARQQIEGRVAVDEWTTGRVAPDRSKAVPQAPRRPLARKFGILFGALLAVIAANFLLVNHALERLHGVADSVNAIGRMRMLSMRVAYEASRDGSLSTPGEAAPATGVGGLLAELDQGLAAMRDGGRLFGFRVRQLPAEFSGQLYEIGVHLGRLRQDAEAVGGERDRERQRIALRTLAADSSATVHSIDALVAALTRQAQRDEQHLMLTLYGLLGANLLLLAIGMTALRRRVVDPVLHLIDLSREFAAGDFRQRTALQSSDELGLLACSLNRMAERTETYISRLDQLSSALEGSSAAAVITDTEGNIEYVNAQFHRLTGYSADEVLGRNPRFLQSGQTPRETYQEIWAALRAGRGWNGELLDRRKDGQLVWFHGSYSVVRNAEAVVTHFVAVYQDLTEQKRTMAALDRANLMLRLLLNCTEVLVNARDEDELLDHLCAHIIEVGGYRRVEVSLEPSAAADGEARTVRRQAEGASAEVESESRLIRLPLTYDNRSLGMLCIETVDGEPLDASELVLLRDLAADLSYGLVSLTERDARRAAERSLSLRNKAIESSNNGIVITDCSGSSNLVVYVNPAFERITGYSAREVVGRNPRFLLRGGGGQSGVLELRAALREEREGRALLANFRKDGSRFWNDLSVSPVPDEDGRVAHFVGVLNDVTEIIEYQEQLAHQANHDTLTGLANRNLLLDRLNQAVYQAQRSGHPFAVIFFDIDHFKFINDSLGHAAGDTVVRAVAERVRATVRDFDTVARLGGDEFVLVLPECGGDLVVTATLQRILATIAEPIRVAESALQITCSMGVSLFPMDGDDPETLLKNADAAMYEAKAHGRNQFQFYTREINLRVLERVTLEASLRAALRNNEFYLDFQPQCDMQTRRVVGAEALLRWRHPENGIVPPAAFIPVAEENGLIVELGAWVLDAACAQLQAWQREGLPPVKLAVNFSARQFQQADLGERIARTLDRYGIDPQYLEIELTESMLMRDPEKMNRVLGEIKAMGVRVSLDDFGTGYSSLSYLKRFPIDTLKLDKAFVRDITFDPVDAAISRAVITMAHSMGLKVVAEGVETEGQLNYLRSQQCNEMQGFYFSRPLQADAFAELLATGRALEFPSAVDDSCVLVVENGGGRSELADLLSSEGYNVRVAGDAQEAFEVLGSRDVRMVIAEYPSAELSGIEFLGRVRALYPAVARVLLMGQQPDIVAVEHAINHGGIHKLLLRPWGNGEVLLMAREALKRAPLPTPLG